MRKLLSLALVFVLILSTASVILANYEINGIIFGEENEEVGEAELILPAPPMETATVLQLNQPISERFVQTTANEGERWFAFFVHYEMSAEITLRHGVNLNVDMELFDENFNENSEYFTVQRHMGTELNGNLTLGWNLIRVFYEADTTNSFEPDFFIVVDEGPRVLVIDEEYASVNVESPQTFVFMPPMDAEYEIITSGGALTGSLYDSILGGLALTTDNDSRSSLHMVERLMPDRRYYVTVNETADFFIRVQRYQPAGNVTLRMEQGDDGRIGFYINNLNEDIAQISFRLDFDEDDVNFHGFMPSSELPDGASAFISEDGEWVTFLLLDEEFNLLPISDTRLFDFYFSGESDFGFSEAFVVGVDDVIFPNLEVTDAPIRSDIMSERSVSDTFSYVPFNLLQGGTVYVMSDYEWVEYVPEHEEMNRGFDAFSAVAPMSFPNLQSEFNYARQGRYSETWLNAPMLRGDINVDGRTNSLDHSMISNMMHGHYPLPHFERRIIAHPSNFRRGIAPTIDYRAHAYVWNITRGLTPMGPVFQVVRPKEVFTSNITVDELRGTTFASMKIGTTHINREAVGGYWLEISNDSDVPLYFWLTQDNSSNGILVSSARILAGQIFTIPKELQGLYFLRVSRNAQDTLPVMRDDFSVRLQEREDFFNEIIHDDVTLNSHMTISNRDVLFTGNVTIDGFAPNITLDNATMTVLGTLNIGFGALTMQNNSHLVVGENLRVQRRINATNFGETMGGIMLFGDNRITVRGDFYTQSSMMENFGWTNFNLMFELHGNFNQVGFTNFNQHGGVTMIFAGNREPRVSFAGSVNSQAQLGNVKIQNTSGIIRFYTSVRGVRLMSDAIIEGRVGGFVDIVDFDLNGFTATIEGNFFLGQGNRLEMNNDSDMLIVTGDFFNFSGVNTMIERGTLELQGNYNQFSDNRFETSPNAQVRLTGDRPQEFTLPIGATVHFHNLLISQPMTNYTINRGGTRFNFAQAQPNQRIWTNIERPIPPQPENTTALLLNQTLHDSFPTQISNNAERWYAFYANAEMSVEVVLRNDMNHGYLNIDMQLFDAELNENSEYFTVPRHRGIELNGNINHGWNIIRVFYTANTTNTITLSHLANFYDPKFSIVIREGARVLAIDEEYTIVNGNSPRTFVFKPPMEAIYEVITTGNARTGAMYDSILGGLALTNDSNALTRLYLQERMIPERRYYVRVNEPGNSTIRIQRHQPPGNVTLRMEQSDVAGRIGFYIDNLNDINYVGQISFSLEFDDNDMNFAGFAPNSVLPSGTSVFISESGDRIALVLLDEEFNPSYLQDIRLFDYYFAGNSDFDFSEAFVVGAEDIFFPNLEINYAPVGLNEISTRSLSDSSELLQGGTIYVLANDEWIEYMPEITEENNEFAAFSNIEPFNLFPNLQSEVRYSTMGEFSEAWLNAPMLLGDINVDGRFNAADTDMVRNIRAGITPQPQLEQRIIANGGFRRGEPPRIDSITYATFFNINIGNVTPGPVFQIIRPRPNSEWIPNDTSIPTWGPANPSNVMKVGTTHDANRQGVGRYSLEIRNNRNFPLYFWLVQSNGDILVGRESILPGQTEIIHGVQGLYFLTVSRNNQGTTLALQSGDYSVRLVETRETPGITSNRIHEIRHTNASDRVLTVSSELLTPNNSVVMQVVHNARNAHQRFRLIYVGNGEYKIEPMHATGVANGRVVALNNNRQLIIDTDTNATRKRWNIVSVQGGFRLVNRAHPTEFLSFNGTSISLSNVADASTVWQITPVQVNVRVRVLYENSFFETLGSDQANADRYANLLLEHASISFMNRWGLQLNPTPHRVQENHTHLPIDCPDCTARCALSFITWMRREHSIVGRPFDLQAGLFTFTSSCSQGRGELGLVHSSNRVRNATDISLEGFVHSVRIIQHEISHNFSVRDDGDGSMCTGDCIMQAEFVFSDIPFNHETSIWCSRCERDFDKNKFR